MGRTTVHGIKPAPEEAVLKMPDLETLSPEIRNAIEKLEHIDLRNLLRPDLTVTAKAIDCGTLEFTAIYSPPMLQPKPQAGAMIQAEVRVFVAAGRIKKKIADFYLDLPALGGSTTVKVVFTPPAGTSSITHIDTTTFTVQIDPDNHIIERNESNNVVTVTGTC